MGVYRKSHIPNDVGYQEKTYFSPGDTGFKVWQTQHAKIGVGVCWDQWFPEAARCMALQGAEVLLYPTAIGSEPGNTKIDSARHWQNAMCGHAAANVMPVVASNRIGLEESRHGPAMALEFYGSSFIADQTGVKVEEANRTDETVLVHTFDMEAVRHHREMWGVYRDRRPDLYSALGTLDGRGAPRRGVRSSARAEHHVTPRCRVEECPGVRVRRLGIDLLGRPLLDHQPVLHDHDPVADLGRDAQVVGDEQHGEIEAFADIVQEFEHLGLDRDVECRDRFVGDQHLRFHGKRAGNADALALAAGELVRKPLQRFGCEADHAHQFGCAGERIGM